MDSSDTPQLNAIEIWLNQWQQWLDQWLACGVTNPTPHALAQLKHWAANSHAAGWEALTDLAEILIASDSAEARAEAFLDLMVRYQVTVRSHSAPRIQVSQLAATHAKLLESEY